MRTKFFEVRDSGTFILVLATQLVGTTRERAWALDRCGYNTLDSPEPVIMCRLDNGSGNNHWSDWEGRTMGTAHEYIEKNFDGLEDGAVIDVEFIRGETKTTKTSERES